MEVEKQGNGIERSITQREAAEIIELWSWQSSKARESLLSVDDVREVLSISEGEAMDLLAQVRRDTPAAPRRRRLTHRQTTALYWAIGIWAVNGGGFAIWIAKLWIEGSRVSHGDATAAIVGILSSLLSIWYFRRPIKRTLSGLGRQLNQGMP